MGLTGCNDEAFDIDSVNKQTLLIMYPWSGTETRQDSTAIWSTT